MLVKNIVLEKFLEWARKQWTELTGKPSDSEMLLAAIEHMALGVDSVLRAPYLEAKEHFKNGANRLGYEKLVKAIAYDCLNDNARRLYIVLLMLGRLPFPETREQQFSRAEEESFKFLDDFGFRGDCIEPVIYKEWVREFGIPDPGVNFQAFKIAGASDFYPNFMFCNRTGLVAQFRCKASIMRLFEGTHVLADGYSVESRNWEGKTLVRVPASGNTRLLAFTKSYLAVQERSVSGTVPECSVYSLSGAIPWEELKPTKFLTRRQVDSLFGAPTASLEEAQKWHSRTGPLEYSRVQINTVNDSYTQDYRVGGPQPMEWSWGAVVVTAKA